MCLPHHRALPEEDVAIHHQGNLNMQLAAQQRPGYFQLENSDEKEEPVYPRS